MKKKILLILMALLSTSIFARNIQTVQKKEEDIVKQFEGKVFKIHYKIIRENNGQAMLSITDDTQDQLEVRVFTDTINEAFDKYFDIESSLLDSYIEVHEDEALVNLVSQNPLFFLIVGLYDKNYDWKEDLATGSYYYEIDERTEIPDYDTDENNDNDGIYIYNY